MAIDPATAELAETIADLIAQKLYDNPPTPIPWMNSEEVAKHIGMSTRSLETLRREHRGPLYVRVGYKVVRYAREDVESWMREHSVDPQAGS